MVRGSTQLILLYTRASLALESFTLFCNTFACQEIDVKVAQLKDLPRVLEKITLRSEGLPWDILRARLSCKTCSDIVRILATVQRMKIPLVGIVNRFAAPRQGRTDASLYLAFPKFPGSVAEVQIIHQALYFKQRDDVVQDAYQLTASCKACLSYRSSWIDPSRQLHRLARGCDRSCEPHVPRDSNTSAPMWHSNIHDHFSVICSASK
jgi:hypothetical protein